MDKFTEMEITRIEKGRRTAVTDTVVTEARVEIYLDDVRTAVLLCSPGYLKELAIGFLFTEGLIASAREITDCTVIADKGRVSVMTKSGGNPLPATEKPAETVIAPGSSFAPPMENHIREAGRPLRMASSEAFRLIGRLHEMSKLHAKTGGVHGAALWRNGEVLFFREDIGRLNALDRTVGAGLLNGVPLGECVLLTSGRVSSAVVGKVARARVPALLSPSAVTDGAVLVARERGILLAGFVRDGRMNVYSREDVIV